MPSLQLPSSPDRALLCGRQREEVPNPSRMSGGSPYCISIDNSCSFIRSLGPTRTDGELMPSGGSKSDRLLGQSTDGLASRTTRRPSRRPFQSFSATWPATSKPFPVAPASALIYESADTSTPVLCCQSDGGFHQTAWNSLSCETRVSRICPPCNCRRLLIEQLRTPKRGSSKPFPQGASSRCFSATASSDSPARLSPSSEASI